MKYFETTNFFRRFLLYKEKMSHQNTNKCLNRGLFTLNLVKH